MSTGRTSPTGGSSAGQSPVRPNALSGGPAATDEQIEQGEGSKDASVEMQRPRMPHRPQMPSLTEREEHEASGHAVYRTWCEHCVAAKGQGNPHIADGEECDIPEVGFDYGYMSRDQAKCMPILCARDRKSASHTATYVKSKGRDPYALSFLVSWVRGLGYKRFVC